MDIEKKKYILQILLVAKFSKNATWSVDYGLPVFFFHFLYIGKHFFNYTQFSLKFN
jgi:hypothetical protein